MHGTEYETEYSKVIKKLLKTGIHIQTKEDVIGAIIVDEGKEGLNTKIRKFFYTKLRHKELETILISQFDSESKKIAYLLKQAVREVLFTPLLPKDFLEALIVYTAYKFARREPAILRKVVNVLAGEFSELKYNNCIIKLDSSDFEKQIVLNAIPYARPLFEENILPMIAVQTQKILNTVFESEGEEVTHRQQQADFIMRWIGRLCDNKVRIIWIGTKETKDYLYYLSKDDVFNSFHFFIFGARHYHIDKLNYLVNKRLPLLYPNCDLEKTSIEGKWIYKSKITNFKWIFCRKSAQDNRNNDQLGLFRSPKKSL